MAGWKGNASSLTKEAQRWPGGRDKRQAAACATRLLKSWPFSSSSSSPSHPMERLLHSEIKLKCSSPPPSSCKLVNGSRRSVGEAGSCPRTGPVVAVMLRFCHRL
ncbi:hypothetical protein MHYP_G00138720 [Metynnis hypsauchen]